MTRWLSLYWAWLLPALTLLPTLARLRAGFDRERGRQDLALHRLDLALDGRAVMEILGCPPGPEVGRALRALTERVLEDPTLNTAERLRETLLEGRRARQV